ncbi:MAG: adenosylcobinamide-GDP ribazoletransferase [Thermodesulfobacteriota bacterium]
MRGFLLALRFLMIIPLGRAGTVDEGDITRSVSYYPVVGMLQGGILVGSALVLGRWFTGGLLSCILVLILVLTNGGFHLDGFMDTVDGVAGGSDKESRLRIMSDPNAGAVGVVFTFFIIALKVLALAAMPAASLITALFLWPILGRWSIVPLALFSDYAREGAGLGRAVTEIGWREFLTATLITLALFFYPLGLWAFPVLVFTGGVAFVVSLFLRTRLGGVTGDVFGFQSEISEVFFLLFFLIITC